MLSLGLGLSLTKGGGVPVVAAYSLFVPAGSTGLITANGLTFKVRE